MKNIVSGGKKQPPTSRMLSSKPIEKFDYRDYVTNVRSSRKALSLLRELQLPDEPVVDMSVEATKRAMQMFYEEQARATLPSRAQEIGQVEPKMGPSVSKEEAYTANLKPLGNRDVASMRKNFAVKTRSAGNLVLTIRNIICNGSGASASVVQITESLIWPFVARKSLRKSSWFTDKEFGRFVKSMRYTHLKLRDLESADNREQSFVKFWIDTYLCQVFLDPSRPVRDDWMEGPLFKGWCRIFIARAVARRDVRFIFSLQKGTKKLWPALGEVKKQQAFDKHKLRLSESHGDAPADLIKEIHNVVFSLFGGLSDARPTKFLPSGSACLQASRRKGGALSLSSRYQFPDFHNLRRTAPLWGSSGIMERRLLSHSLTFWRTTQFNQMYDAAKKNLEREHYRFTDLTELRNGRIRQIGIYSPPGLSVEVIAIPEPGKYRIITLGDGFLYSALQPIQGLLLGAWKKSRYSTMRSDDLTERVRQLDRSEFPYWCSVDYEAATDLIKRDCTLAFLDRLRAPFRDLAIASLAPGLVKYPDGSSIYGIEGQLMGHPLSFPILCAINLAVYRLAIRRYNEFHERISPWHGRWARKRTALMWHNVIVNGDDMLFKCDRTFYHIFLRCCREAGFKVSQGKNYLSPDCAMINSQVFQRNMSTKLMERRGYLNLKFIMGSSLKGGESLATPDQLGRDLGLMVRHCPWAACLIPSVFKRWKSDWFGKTYQPNWYLPVHLGGFGVPRALAPSTLKITRSQRLMAARFVNDPRMALYRRAGMTIETAILAGSLAKWRYQVGDYVPNKNEMTNEDPWLDRLAYASRAHHGSNPTSDAAFIARFKPEYRLKPMSDEGLSLYWNARVVASNLPPCPPISDVPIRAL